MYIYTYDSGLDTYTLDSSGVYFQGEPLYPFAVNDVTAWICYNCAYEPGLSLIRNYDIAEPETVLHEIILNYLGTTCKPVTMEPHDVVIDGEYLHIIVVKDGKLQLLTIKPLYDE